MTKGSIPAGRTGRGYEQTVPVYRYVVRACGHEVTYRQRLEYGSTGWCYNHSSEEGWQAFTNVLSEAVEILPRPYRSDMSLLNPAKKQERRQRILSDRYVSLQYDKALLKNRVRDELASRTSWEFTDAADVLATVQQDAEKRLAKLSGNRRHRKDKRGSTDGLTLKIVMEVMTDMDGAFYFSPEEHHEEEDDAA